jgi:hypothetical protein
VHQQPKVTRNYADKKLASIVAEGYCLTAAAENSCSFEDRTLCLR